MVNNKGANTGTALSLSHIQGAYNNMGGALPDTYLFCFVSNREQTFTFSGLPPNQSFVFFLYAYNTLTASNDRDEIFTVGDSSFDTVSGAPSSEDSRHAVTGELIGVTSSTGTIDGTWAFGPTNMDYEIDWSAFQIDVGPSAHVISAVPEPSSFFLSMLGLVALLTAAGHASSILKTRHSTSTTSRLFDVVRTS
ncbi:MAG: hypothetical protein ACRD19_09870 [Terriglobia bacterium]